MRKALLALLLAVSSIAGPPAAGADGAFAVVDGAVISAADYEAALQGAVRQKFYHRQVPEAQLQEFQREVAGMLIDRVLLLAESRRRGVAPDRGRVEKALAEYEKRYAGSAAWQQKREALLSGLRRELEERDLLEQLQAMVRAVEAPSEAQLRAYYEERRELFIEPEQTRLAVILLKVEPSSPKAAWERAREEAHAIRGRIEAGADFAELARSHSGDATASRGGDMGYLHQGMIPEPLYAQLGTMKAGELSEPIRVLDGIALFRLTAKTNARQQGFEETRTRAAQLWQRERGELRWKALISSLRAAATIRIDLARYPALSGIAP